MNIPYIRKSDLEVGAILLYVHQGNDRDFSGLFTMGKKYAVVDEIPPYEGRVNKCVRTMDDDDDVGDPWCWADAEEIVNERVFISYDALSTEDKFLLEVGGLDALFGE